MNVLRQGLGISPPRLDRLLAVGLVDAERTTGAHAMRMQKNHDFAHQLLLRPCCLDLSAPGWTNPIDFLEPRRALVNDGEDFFTESVHQLLGVDRTDAFDQAAAKILFHALTGIGSTARYGIGPKLEPMLSVPDPGALSGNPLT